nr:hypothetical protein Iba_chr02dCG16070 [Ipomoea batatas]
MRFAGGRSGRERFLAVVDPLPTVIFSLSMLPTSWNNRSHASFSAPRGVVGGEETREGPFGLPLLDPELRPVQLPTCASVDCGDRDSTKPFSSSMNVWQNRRVKPARKSSSSLSFSPESTGEEHKSRENSDGKTKFARGTDLAAELSK